MGVGDKANEIVAKINALEDYRKQFQKVFPSDVTAENMMKAIAAYERTIISGNTPWDRYRAGENLRSVRVRFAVRIFPRRSGATTVTTELYLPTSSITTLASVWTSRLRMAVVPTTLRSRRYRRVQNANVERRGEVGAVFS